MPTSRTGGCLCGAVRYAISAPITELRACHCIDCQRASGSHDAKKADSGRTLIRYFCGECGSQLYSHRETTHELLGVRAGTLDDSADLKISTHIWTKSARPWSHLDPAAKQVEGQPS